MPSLINNKVITSATYDVDYTDSGVILNIDSTNNAVVLNLPISVPGATFSFYASGGSNGCTIYPASTDKLIGGGLEGQLGQGAGLETGGLLIIIGGGNSVYYIMSSVETD